MRDEDLIKELIEAYEQSPNAVELSTTEEVDLAESVMVFMINATRDHPPLPEHINPKVDTFSTFNFLVHHQPNGTVKITAKSMTTPGRTSKDLEEDVGALRHYLETLVGMGQLPKLTN
jgi:hypothetical protein